MYLYYNLCLHHWNFCFDKVKVSSYSSFINLEFGNNFFIEPVS